MFVNLRLLARAATTALGFLLAINLLPGLIGTASAEPGKAKGPKSGDLYFQREAGYPVFLNACAYKSGDPVAYEDCINDSSYAEILAPSEDGNTVVYIGARFGPDPEEDPEYFFGIVGFLDITDPSNPVGLGVIEMPDVEPTSVGIVGDYALVAVDTSPNFVAPSGELRVIHIPTQTLVRTMQLGGQPDSVAISPDKKYAAIAIENQRDEDFEPTDGAPPQAPGGLLVIVDIGPKAHPKNGLQVDPNNFSLRTVSLMGYADLFPNDPETEYVDINHSNIAAITLQENNHIVLVNLVSGNVIGHFSAGAADLTQIDVIDEADEGDAALITQTASLDDVLREPDAIAWISQALMATADEGDLDGGSRGFTIFDKDGEVVYASGNEFEHLAARIGHYPDRRSDAKGTEPEGATADQFGPDMFLFIASERASFVGVYKVGPGGQPIFHQVLPGGMGPEGLTTVPSRGLFMTSSENDARALTFRSLITIYELKDEPPSYPTIVSADRANGVPIPWAGLSGLANDPWDPTKAYTIYDSFFLESRIFVIDMSQTPPVITEEIPLIEGGSTVNLDPEGIAVRSDGTFWLATEGAGNGPGAASPNQLIKVDTDGTVLSRVSLPAALNLQQRSNGFEGVTVTGTVGVDEVVYVAFQRAWTLAGDADGNETRIGRYDVAADAWTFAYYPLDPVETTAAGDWIGLSELTYVGNDTFVVIERDKQNGLDAFVKRLYQFSVAGVEFKPTGEALETLSKTLLRDVLPDMAAPNGAVIEKLEGFMKIGDDGWIVVDNDGTDDSNGETQLIKLPGLFE
jgi:hypothetical protein